MKNKTKQQKNKNMLIILLDFCNTVHIHGYAT